MQRTITVRRGITARELSAVMFIPAAALIKELMAYGIRANINRPLDDAEIKLLADAFLRPVVIVD